nr:reverse transcriptase domain-containing protein [Tanacetum cinerariifolium]
MLEFVKAVEESCVTCGRAHAYYNCPNTDSNQPGVCVAMGTYNQVAPQNRASNFMAPRGFAPVVERETEETTDKEQTNFQRSTAHIQPPVTLIPEPDVPKTLPKPNIPYPSRLNDQKLREKASNQMEKFFQIFQDLHFDISFADALILMPKFTSMIKSLLTNNDKLFELAKIPLNENCSAMLLKKLLEKLGDPSKFLIPCDFLGMDVCHALADLGASINLMPLSIWKKLSLPKITPTRMTLELFDRSITRPKGVAEDVFVKVGKFHFPTDFVVLDFEADPRVPLILGRSFLRTGRALIDVYGEEITLWVNDEAVTFNLIQTTRYSSTYDDLSRGVCSGNSWFSSNSLGDNPTSTFEPIISDSSPSLTPFEGSDFIFEEIDAYLKDESVSPEIDHADCDPEGDICLIEKLLNDDPFQLPPMDLKQGEVVKAKSLIEEPPELELKELPSHLEYDYLEGVDKLPVIISKDLKVHEKEALLKVLKSHKKVIAWKITDIKGIDPRFCTHKILMEEDYKPAVQSQRRVNLKIHEVIPIHCVPKKGGITVVENKNNELIPTRLVTRWRVCIDYRKLNDATCKDHSPLLFMDQMLERLAGNELYCFLDGFSGYFQIPINPPDQEKTTFTCPYGTFAYRRMPFGLCNAPWTFQRCMMAIFHDMIEKTMEVFMDDFLRELSSAIKSPKNGIEVDRSKVDVIAKPPYLMTVKGVRSFFGHAGFYRRFIQDFSKIAKPMTHLLEKETLFVFSKDCIDAFETLNKKLTEALILVVLDWNLPFKLMYFMGPFPSSRGNRYILVAVDYLSKWVESKALPTNDARVVVKFLKSLFARFETPRAIISDRGTYFCNDKFAKVMSKYGVTHRLSTAYHPQISSQVEVSNRGLKRILERTIGENRASWSEKLDDALWAFRTAYKTLIGCTPYKLVYGKSCHLPIELEHTAYWALKHVNFDFKTAGDHRKLQLNELNELRDQAYENSLIYKEKTKKIHDSKIKNRIFNVGDRVLLFNSRLKIFSGKLKTRWSGPFTITKVFPYGTVELSQPDGPNFKVNGHRMKHYFEGDVPHLVVPDLQTFPIDK